MKYLNLFKIGRRNVRYFSNDVRHKLQKSYFYMTGSTPLSSATVGDVLDQAANKAGDETAFISEHQGISKTYEEFRKDVDKLASGLIAHGLEKEDRIALYCPNCYEWPMIQFAAAKAGLVLVNINPVSQPNELEYCLRKVGCKAVISFDKFKKQDGYEILNKIIPNFLESNPKSLQCKNLPSLKSIIMLSEENKKGTITFQEVFSSGNKDSRNILSQLEKTIQIDDPVNIQFTSGTTGTPKAAILSHHGIVNNALLSSTRQGFHKKKHILCYQVPMFHIIGCVLSTLAMVLFQGTCVIPSSSYYPKAILKCIEKYKCTTTIGTPTMYIDLLKIYEELHNSINSLKHVIVGGAPPSENLLIDLNKKLNSPFVQIIYGLTEVSGCILIGKEDSDYETKIKGYMPPIEHLEVKVVDEKGSIVPPNNPGELCSRGFSLFLGYSDDEQTAKVVDKAHWFHTGDLAVMNEKGELKIVGRIKDMVVRGGENIYCLEVENFLSSHPAVLDVHIVGVPDERMGEELCCWIAVKPGMSVTEEDIKNFCKGKISHFKIPRYIIFVKEFPKTFSGKVKKFEMAKISKEAILQ